MTIIEKVVAFCKKYFTLSKLYVAKIVAHIVKAWIWLMAFTTTQEFVLTYPLVIFATLAICLHSVLMVLVLAIWFIPFIRNINEKE
jgi:hypothetical protein